MLSLGRRAFLGNLLGGLVASGTPSNLPAKDKKPKVSGDGLDTLFLTWQRDPTTTITVQWIGPAAAGGMPAIQFATLDEGSAWQTATTHSRPYPLTDNKLHVFRTELTGLSAGTEYQFRIGSGKTARRFRTMPAKATDSFTFVSGGDCGTGKHAIANNIQAAKHNPMFTLIAGDLGYDDGKKLDRSLDFMHNYSKHMVDSQGRMIPLVVGIGNHEVDGGYGKPREEARFFFALHDGLYRERSYATLDFGDYLSLVLLDTGHVSRIDGEQTSWLKRSLAEHADYPHLIVANHVPAYPSYRKADDEEGGKSGTGELNRTHWVPLFEKHNVTAVLEHHDHTFKRTHLLKDGRVAKDGILYLGDGSWGKLRSPQSPEDRPYLAATSRSYHVTMHRLEGDRCQHLAMEEDGNVVDQCTTQKRAMRRVGRS